MAQALRITCYDDCVMLGPPQPPQHAGARVYPLWAADPSSRACNSRCRQVLSTQCTDKVQVVDVAACRWLTLCCMLVGMKSYCT